MRVLVVDNDRDTADVLSLLLKAANCDVQVAYNGAACLELATRFQPDLLLADVGMPAMDGNELARQIRRCRELDHTVLAAVTGWADAAHRQFSIDAGFDEYFVKPVPFDRLCELLDRVRARIARSHQLAEEAHRVASQAHERAEKSRRP